MAMICRARTVSLTASATVLMALVFSPGVAQAGFFEQLFGVAPVQQAPALAPAPSADLPMPALNAPVRHEPRKRKRLVETKPVKQMPTDLMHDKTLQVGDAVMMKGGIHVYQGPEEDRHTRRQFVALNDADSLSHKEREKLASMDMVKNDPLRGNISPDTIASGRSAAVAAPLSAGYRITDARGQSVRYVGP